MIRKLPRVTFLFWVMKVCATTLGETAGDLFSMTLGGGYGASSLGLIAFFAVTVTAQLWTSRYRPWLYWMVILATSTAGTTMSDFMDRTVALGYAKGSALLVAILAGVLTLWRATEKTLAVDRIETRRAELFYWAAILWSNTLGTALGDFLADDSGLGFGGGATLIGALLAITVLLTFFTRVSRVALFWVAFVLTRPFGATMGDVLTKPHEAGGLDFGTTGSSAILGAILFALVAYATWAERRAPAR